jgi:hypothetical protein
MKYFERQAERVAGLYGAHFRLLPKTDGQYLLYVFSWFIAVGCGFWGIVALMTGLAGGTMSRGRLRGGTSRGGPGGNDAEA